MDKNKRILDIEFLRGFGMIFIMHHHIYGNLITWNNTVESVYRQLGFNFWLDVFFVISGFVISRSLIEQVRSCSQPGEFTGVAVKFWLRRIWRLIPTAWLWLFIILISSAFFNQSGAFGSFKSNVEATVAAVLQIANIRFVDAWTNFFYGASFHYWSLSLEEQFYLVFPFMILLSGRWLVYVLVLIVVSQFFIDRPFLLYMLRTDGFAMGVLLAMWAGSDSYKRFEPKFLRGNRTAQWSIGVLLMSVLPILDSASLQPVFFSKGLVVLLCAFVIFLTSYNQDYLWVDGHFKRFFIWLGARSYTLYVIHVPVYCLARELWFRIEPPGTVFDETYTFKFLLTAVVLLAAFTELNFRFIEKPLRTRGLEISNAILTRHGVKG